MVLFDGGSGGEHRKGLRLGSPEAGFLVSLRHGFLPLRLCDRVVLEPYMPHRSAHQFGLDQCILADVSSSSGICADLAGAARCWTSFFRVETQARFVMPRASRFVIFTTPYERWFRDMVHVCYVQTLEHWMKEVLPQPGDHTGVRPVPPFDLVPDMQSRDSHFFTPRITGQSSFGVGMFFLLWFVTFMCFVYLH